MSAQTPWLQAFVAADRFFSPCGKCSSQHSARDASLNYYDVSAQHELCSVCLLDHPAKDSIIQVRRSSYHDVVKVGDITRLADIAGVQSYVINGSKVVFLRRRPQPRPPKGAVGASQCAVCTRHLQDVSHFCSLQCKLDACSDAAPAAPQQHARSKPAAAEDSRASGSKDSSPDTPQHDLAAKLLLDSGSDSDTGGESQPAKRRKGAAFRSPFE